jgi:hypothetical protein
MRCTDEDWLTLQGIALSAAHRWRQTARNNPQHGNTTQGEVPLASCYSQ